MAERFEYRFDWDPTKAARNAKDHGVTFEQGATVFLDARLLSQLDEEHGVDEERWLSLGLDKAARLCRLSYVSRCDATARDHSDHLGPKSHAI